jgi:hypothetical protein
LSIEHHLQSDVATLVAITHSPLDIVESQTFAATVNDLQVIGRKAPKLQIGLDGFKFTRTQTRQCLINLSHQKHDNILSRFAEMPCVSLAIDAGTIESRHFLDIMILAPYSDISTIPLFGH